MDKLQSCLISQCTAAVPDSPLDSSNGSCLFLHRFHAVHMEPTPRHECRMTMQEKTRRAKLNSEYIVLESRKDGTKFTSKKMRDFAISIFEHTQRYSKVQNDLLQSVSSYLCRNFNVKEPTACYDSRPCNSAMLCPGTGATCLVLLHITSFTPT